MLNFLSTEIHKAWSLLWNKAAPPVQHEVARAAIDKRFNDLKATLEKHPYLMGDTFSVADAYLFTLANWGQWPWIKAHHARVGARPAVQAVIAAERASK